MRECVLFDVTGENLAGMGKDLWGFALTPKGRKPLKERALPNGKHGVHSKVLGLIAYVAERTRPAAPKETWALTMRWYDPATMADIPDFQQSRAETAQARAGMARAQAEAQAERVRADAAEVEAAQARADVERVQAEARIRAEADQRRIAELEGRLRQQRGGS